MSVRIKDEEVLVATIEETPQVNYTQRDAELLTWIGEMKWVRLDHLSLLLQRYTHYNTEHIDKITHKLVTKWKNSGLVDKKQFARGEYVWVWLTKEGLEQAGLSYKYLEPAIGELKHDHMVNALRIQQENKYKGEFVWVSEREIDHNMTPQERMGHKADAEIHFTNGSVIGIEVERSRKIIARIDSVLAQLAARYRRVYYYVTSETKVYVQNAIGRLKEENRNKFQIRDFDEFVSREQSI